MRRTTDADILRRAYERAQEAETYDPGVLLGEVMDLLRGRGLHPDLPEGDPRVGDALVAACHLLRACGIAALRPVHT